MTDNFEQIVNILKMKPMETGDFYFLQIVRRKKDNPDLGKHRELVDTWYIKDVNHLVEKKAKIIEQCNLFNARAYFRLNKRNQQKVAMQTLALMASCVASNNFDVKNCYESCAGKHHSDPDKTWVVDIDYGDGVDATFINEVASYIAELVKETGKNVQQHMIPSKNGIHIICRPFNLKLFKDRYPTVDVHKDNPTILYVP